jgi:hypothetical protein
MNRAMQLGLLIVFISGCQTPGERLPLRQLPEDSPPLPYAELLTRARLQASAANEAFYLDRWPDLEYAAGSLEQTARFLPKATEVPAQHKDDLPTRAEELSKEAKGLREAAKAKDVKQANGALQRINLQVRELRLD